jgi:hypothetical protein
MGQWGCVGSRYMQDYTHEVFGREIEHLNQVVTFQNIGQSQKDIMEFLHA